MGCKLVIEDLLIAALDWKAKTSAFSYFECTTWYVVTTGNVWSNDFLQLFYNLHILIASKLVKKLTSNEECFLWGLNPPIVSLFQNFSYACTLMEVYAPGGYLVCEMTGMSEPKFENRPLERLNFENFSHFLTLRETIFPKIQLKSLNLCPNFKNLRPFEGVDFWFS